MKFKAFNKRVVSCIVALALVLSCFVMAVAGALIDFSGDSGDGKTSPEAPKTALQQQVDEMMQGKSLQYHLTEDEESGRRELHIRLNRGKAMIIDLNQGGDVKSRITHDLAYITRLVELARLFPYRLIGPKKKIEWITASRTEN